MSPGLKLLSLIEWLKAQWAMFPPDGLFWLDFGLALTEIIAAMAALVLLLEVMITLAFGPRRAVR